MTDKSSRSSKTPHKRVRGKGKNIHSDELRDITSSAAFELFLENGYDETSMRMIFERTGYGAGSTYNAFSGKDEILIDIVMNTFNQLLDKTNKLIQFGVDRYTAVSFPISYILYMSSNNRGYADIYYNACRNWKVSNRVIDRIIEWKYQNLDEGETIDEDFLRNTFRCTMTMMSRFLQEFYEEGPKDCTQALHYCLKSFYWLLETPRESLNDDISKFIGFFKKGFFESNTYFTIKDLAISPTEEIRPVSNKQ